LLESPELPIDNIFEREDDILIWKTENDLPCLTKDQRKKLN
jgi:hypothetical protein